MTFLNERYNISLSGLTGPLRLPRSRGRHPRPPLLGHWQRRQQGPQQHVHDILRHDIQHVRGHDAHADDLPHGAGHLQAGALELLVQHEELLRRKGHGGPAVPGRVSALANIRKNVLYILSQHLTT